MQFTKATLLAVLAALVLQTSAQTISDLIAQIPACSLTCLSTAIPKSGCGLTDYVCQCTTGRNAILAASAGCISTGCSTDDALTTTNVTNKICVIAQAAPASSSAAAPASSASSAAAGASTSASVAATTATSASSVAVSMSSSVSSAVMASTSAAASAASSAASAASTAASTAAGSATSSDVNPTSSSNPSTSSAVSTTATSSPTPIGAIIGGVIGGLVGLALIGAAIAYLALWARRRRNAAQQATAEIAAAAIDEKSQMPEMQSPPQGFAGAGPGYNPGPGYGNGYGYGRYAGQGQMGMGGENMLAQELHSNPQSPRELPADSPMGRPRHEMP